MATGWHNPTHLVLSVDLRDRLGRRGSLEQGAMATGWHNPTHLVLSVDLRDRLGGRKIWNKRRWRQGGIICLTRHAVQIVLQTYRYT
jgi:hypothetical protein